MAWTYEEVMEKLGDEAQAVPGAILVFRDKHIVVAEVSIGSGFSVTPDGLEILGEKVVKPQGKTKKPAALDIGDLELPS